MSSRHSTAPSSPRKPEQQQPDTQADTRTTPERPAGSPLSWHGPTRRWYKKIRGRRVYFGRGTHAEALEEYNRQKDDLHAGRLPREEQDGLTVFQLIGKFLTAKEAQRDGGELTELTYMAYADICKRILKVFGRNRLVADLGPSDFAKLRASMAKNWGPIRLATEIVRARTPFNWAWKQRKDTHLIQPVSFGDSFNMPAKHIIRQAKAEKGPRLFEAAELRTLLEIAGQPMKTMLLLGINCGFGNADVGHLPLKALDLDRGWLTYARRKTGIRRSCPLWPETIENMREWLDIRPDPKDADHAELVFLTRQHNSWDKPDDRTVSKEMAKLVKKAKLKGNKNFYGLRHCFQTIGDECGDFLAVRSIMGHSSKDIASEYRERISEERLRKVTDHLHDWLFAPDSAGDESDEAEPRILKLRRGKRA